MNPRLTILHKGLFLIAVPLLFQVVFIVILIKLREDGASAVDWTIHTKDVIAQAQSCRVGLLTAHGAIQGYIMTRDPSYVGRLERAISSAPSNLKILEQLVGDREDQTQSARTIRERASRFLDYMVEGRKLVEKSEMSPELAATRRNHSQSLLDTLASEFDRFITFEHDLDATRQKWMRESRAILNQILFGGLAASLLFTSLVAIGFSRNISGRVVILMENTQRLAEGHELAPAISGSDEIARLDRLFHEMATTLSDASKREQHHSRLLERRAEELDAVNAQLREKAEENEMFVYSVSHDLRSPLVNLQGFSKELEMIGKDLRILVDRDDVPLATRRRAIEIVDTDMKESIGFIQSAVTRLSGIIDGLLRLSRAGQVTYRKQEVEVGPIVARVVASLRGSIDDRHATLRVADLPPTWGDPAAIEQVFANLIGNAINYLDVSRPGQIEVLAVDPLEAGPLVTGIEPGPVVYAVRDNGLGISDAYKSKVFAVFQRLHGDVAKGEGVGLALVRRVVERLGGRVWFESKAGVGTTFFVALPSGEAPIAETTDEHDVVPSQTSPETENGRIAEWLPSR